MMRQREIDKKKKREADGAKAQELAEDILEDAEEDHQSVIDKVNCDNSIIGNGSIVDKL